MSTDLKISQLTPATTVNTNDFTVMVDGNTSANKRATVAQILAIAGAGTVTSINVSGANGINSSGGPITSSGTIALSLGAITPTSIVASGTISGSNLSNSNTGDQAITVVGDVTAPASTGTLTTTLANSVVTNDKLADMVGPTVKGRTSGTGIPQDLSTAQVTAMLPEMVADSGTGGTKGLVPPPTAGSAAAKKFLRADATWVATDLNDILPTQSGNIGKVLQTSGTTTSWQAVGVGSVTNVSVTTANGVSGTVANSSTVPAISLTLGAITPTSVNSVVVSGSSTPTLAVTGTSSISNANTGDQTTITGNAGSATQLQTARAINGVNFDGTAAITVTAAGSTLSDTVPIAKGGTGQITAQAALNALLPSQVGATGKNLQSDGTNVSFVADAGGTVTSVAATAGTGITVSGSPITTSGTLTITNSAPDQTVAIAAGTGISVSGTYPSFTVTNSSPSSGGTVTSVAATVPSVFSISGSPITGAGTLAMTYSGTALPVANGGTGVTTSTGTTNVVLSGSPTITTPVIAQINDANGNETLKLASIASAVNEVTIENASTGNPVHIRATGGDASVGLHLVAKGASGYVNVTDGVDETKRLMFNAAGGTTGTRTMLSSTQTVDRTISLPDATDTLVGRATTDTLTNKTITGGILNGTLGATTPSTIAGTTGVFSGTGAFNGATNTHGLNVRGATGFNLQVRSVSSALTLQAANNADTASVAMNFLGSSFAFLDDTLVARATFTSTGLNSTAIGATTPSTGAFTTVSATSLALNGYGNLAIDLSSSSAASSLIKYKGSTGDTWQAGAGMLNAGDWGVSNVTRSVNPIVITGGTTSPTTTFYNNAGAQVGQFSATGLAVTGTLSATGTITASSSSNSSQVKLQGASQNAIAIATAAGSAGLLIGRSYFSDDANDFFIYNLASSAVMMRLTSTGAAITGTLSATGDISSSNGSLNVAKTAASNSLNYLTSATGYGTYLDIGVLGATAQIATSSAGDFSISTNGVAGNVFSLKRSSSVSNTLTLDSGKVFMCGATASVSVERALMQFDGSGAYGFGIKCTAATGSHMRFYNSGGTDNGYIYSTNSTTMVYGSASDGRLKTNIRPLNDSGYIIDAIQPHIFDWKHGETLNCHGFIAQELNEVFPEAVVAGDDDKDVVKSTWGIDPAKLVPVLVAELQSMRKRLAALESK